MSDLVFTRNGKILDTDYIHAVDALLQKVRTRPMWEVIDFLVGVFLKRYPEYKKKIEAPMLNQYGSTKDKSLRSLLTLPPALKDTIDYFYADEIKSRGETKFWREFAKRYPNFSQAEKI